jgi:hypothetical protein
VSEEKKIASFEPYLRAVLVKPAWEFYTVGGFFTLLFVSTWWRDTFASEDWKKRLELRGLLPHWHPAWWLCIALVVLAYLVARNGFTLWKEQAEENVKLRGTGGIRQNEGLPLTAPQVSLLATSQPEMGFIKELLLRNLSPDPMYNLAFQSVQLREKAFVRWNPKKTMSQPSKV